MTDTPFPPFNPSPPTQPEPPAKTETAKQKTAREKREAKSATKQAPTAPATEQPPRQRRKKAEGDKPTLKFDLQTILGAAAELNQDDMSAFQKLVGILQDAGKPGRERLLAAIGKIFA